MRVLGHDLIGTCLLRRNGVGFPLPFCLLRCSSGWPGVGLGRVGRIKVRPCPRRSSNGISPAVPTRTADAEDIAWQNRATTAGGNDAPPSALLVRQASFTFCHTGGGTNCVVDGDTIWIQGEKVRVADIDAPETHDYQCPQEKALGDRATQRLLQLVNSGSITLQPIDRNEDVYGRKLRLVMVNGTSVGDTLVSEGLARYYEGGRRPWC